MRRVHREGVLRRGAGELPRLAEQLGATALATRGVRDAPALEEESDAAAVVSGQERCLRLVERALGVVEASLQPLGAGELSQGLREVRAAVL